MAVDVSYLAVWIDRFAIHWTSFSGTLSLQFKEHINQYVKYASES